MFEDALVESAGRIYTRAGWFSGMAALVNGSVVCLLLVWPLLHLATLPRQTLSTLLTAPPPPAAAAPAVPHPAAGPSRATATANPFTRPRIIYHSIATTAPAPAFAVSLNSFAEPGAVGATGVPDVIGRAPAPAVRVAPAQKRLVLSSGVVAGNKLGGADPLYPAIARAARVQGVVVLAATIAKSGAMENLRVISGPPLLTGAALDAVRGWRYRPYLLNGEPVEVETTVRVIFNLGN